MADKPYCPLLYVCPRSFGEECESHGRCARGIHPTDTGHTTKACECGHLWDVHMAVVGGCGVCSCKAHPPNQPPAPAKEPADA